MDQATDGDLWNWATVGVIAGAVGIVAWAGSAYRWLRGRWQRHRVLRGLLGEVEVQNAVLVAAITGAGMLMATEGARWTGQRLPPPELERYLRDLEGIDRALEHLHARVRGVRSEAAVDRLRADIEQAVTLLRRGVGLHLAGLWRMYKASWDDDSPRFYRRDDDGRRRYGIGASGLAPVPSLFDAESAATATEVIRDLELAVRSAWYQVGDESQAASFHAAWPTYSYELGL